MNEEQKYECYKCGAKGRFILLKVVVGRYVKKEIKQGYTKYEKVFDERLMCFRCLLKKHITNW